MPRMTQGGQGSREDTNPGYSMTAWDLRVPRSREEGQGRPGEARGGQGRKPKGAKKAENTLSY